MNHTYVWRHDDFQLLIECWREFVLADAEGIMSSKYCRWISAACLCNSTKLAAAATGFLLVAAWAIANWYGYNSGENGIMWAGRGWCGGNPRRSCWCRAAAAWCGLYLLVSDVNFAKGWCSLGGVGEDWGIGGVGLCLDECDEDDDDDFVTAEGRGSWFAIWLCIKEDELEEEVDIEACMLFGNDCDDGEDWWDWCECTDWCTWCDWWDCDDCDGWFDGGSIGWGEACANLCSISCSCCNAFTNAVFKRFVCSAFNAFFTLVVTQASHITLGSFPINNQK